LMQEPVAVSIAQKEYLVGFNYSTKGIRSNDFNKFLMYDVGSGQVVSNNEVKVFDKVPELKDVVVRRIDVINESVNVFVDAKYKVGTKGYKSNTLSAVEITTDAFSFGHPHQIVMDYSGEVRLVKPLKRFYNNLS